MKAPSALFVPAMPFAFAMMLAGCDTYTTPIDPAHPPQQGWYAAMIDCKLTVNSEDAANGLRLVSPVVAGVAEMPSYYDRMDACMRSKGWQKDK